MFVNGLVPREAHYACRIDADNPKTGEVEKTVACMHQDTTTYNESGHTLTHWYGKFGKELTENGIRRCDLVWRDGLLWEKTCSVQQVNSVEKRTSASIRCEAPPDTVVDIQEAMFEAKADDWVSCSLNFDEDRPSVVSQSTVVINAVVHPTTQALTDRHQIETVAKGATAAIRDNVSRTSSSGGQVTDTIIGYLTSAQDVCASAVKESKQLAMALRAVRRS